MEPIKPGEKVLLILNDVNQQVTFEEFRQIKDPVVIVAASLDDLDISLHENKYDYIVYQADSNHLVHETNLAKIYSFQKPGTKFSIDASGDISTVELELKLNGFTSLYKEDNWVHCNKPSYDLGSSATINLIQKPTKAVWKIDDTVEDDMIDPDNLLDEDDYNKPDSSSLKVCATTGKRKACKDCSCGLAEELADEKIQNGVDTANAKSSCGSCYLGDAFRCATCPYLGMPAFKPGEKVQLAGNLLKSDI